MQRDDDWHAKRARAKVLVRVLAKFEENFNDPDRRSDPLNTAELRTLDRCADESLGVLGSDNLVSPMINELKAVLLDVERDGKPLSFDAAHRHVGPILAAVEGTYDLSGSSGSRSATKSGRTSQIVVRIDHEEDYE
ncbi:hypothetical protein ACFYPG_21060 [Micromonospora sp. NPDC005553]|uniref:hypothetical protein n=1 Tax=Micromonospora sp. NPDC005553 TaxID=3364232 RepID=UPI0036A5BA6D